MMLLAAALAAALWTPHPSDGVEMHITGERGVARIDFDFHGHAGYAIARRPMSLDLPSNYQLTFRLKANAPRENLELKLIDGDNVWWLNRRDFAFPRTWSTIKTKKRQIQFAWGPAGGGEVRHVEAVEIVVTAGSGGTGTVWIDDLALERLPVASNEPRRFTTNVIDLGEKQEMGGLVIEWEKEPRKPEVIVDGAPHPAFSHPLPAARGEGRVRGFVWLPETEARHISISGAVREVIVQPVTWAPAVNDFYSIVAKDSKRGQYPRYLIGEQPYWTIAGSDGGANEALIGEDGNVEPFKGGYSIEPFLHVHGERLTWADAEITQSLADGYLPIPTVRWKARGVTMTMTAAVSATSMLQLRYHIDGDATLELASRKFQVNPSTQFLNTQGGVSATPVVEGTRWYPHARDVALNIPLQKGAKLESPERIASRWREKLNRVRLDIAGAPEIADTIRSNVAYMLINRDGAGLQPGSRSYERSWIRDGALIASALLRLGHAGEAKAFAEWYARFQFDDGKVPCCVDRRGADPVPENDSHGEFIFLVAEIWRYTRDADVVRRLWPHVDKAAHYIEKLRSGNHGEFEGLVTESISHEGYSAKPVHSYWDDFFALKGLEDAAMLAEVAGRKVSYESMRDDLAASIRRTMAAKKLDYLPGSAELGDFDPSATAIAISPLGLASLLPEPELTHTFDRYFESIGKPREDYTPYEMRIIGALVRRGDRTRALALIERFLRDRRPAAWNQWAEVVGTDARKPRFLGDMPHSWIASDFIRSILDAIAYDREDGTLVVGAGVPPEWLPLRVGPLPTYHGAISITMRKTAEGITVELSGDAHPPNGIEVVGPGRSVTVKELPARVAF